MNYFAVESILREPSSKVAESIIRTAVGLKYSFKSLECWDTLEVGSTKFYRFRIAKSNIVPLIEAIFQSGRSVVSLNGLEYEVKLRNGRKGKLPSTNMLTAPRQQQTFRGSADPFWERQFSPTDI